MIDPREALASGLQSLSHHALRSFLAMLGIIFGVGAVMPTISLMMWRGVRNCPFCPAVAILPSMYSYRSPLVSLSAMSMPSSWSTTLERTRGVGIMKSASFM